MLLRTIEHTIVVPLLNISLHAASLVQDHAILLVNLMLGLGLDAYLCVGRGICKYIDEITDEESPHPHMAGGTPMWLRAPSCALSSSKISSLACPQGASAAHSVHPSCQSPCPLHTPCTPHASVPVPCRKPSAPRRMITCGCWYDPQMAL